MSDFRVPLIIRGAQRPNSLGHATKRAIAGPQDGIEVMRRMCKWILNEVHDSQEVPFWPRRAEPQLALVE